MKDILNRMLNHEELSREETRDIIVGITKSEFPEEQITALLTGLQMRGVTVDELLGFRDGFLPQAYQPSWIATATLTWWEPVATARTPLTFLLLPASSLRVRVTRWQSTATMRLLR